MIDIGVKVEKISLDIKTPTDKRFWARVGHLSVDTIKLRTETRGEDPERRRFIKYSEAYKKSRAKGTAQKGVTGRQVTMPNLSMSGRMLAAMSRGIRPYGGVLRSKSGVKIILSGTEGAKAWGNEANGREFFDLSRKNLADIVKAVDLKLVKDNGLK